MDYLKLPTATAEFTVDYVDPKFLAMFETPTTEITVTHTVTELVGPEHPYFTWEPSDEWYLRWAGIGREVERTVTTTMPTCRITDMNPNGDITFEVLPSAIPEMHCH